MKPPCLFTVQTAKLLQVRRRHHRTQESLWVRHRVPVTLDQPSEADFPIAVRTVTPRRADYRSYRGRIFAPDRVLGMRSTPEFPVEFIVSAFEGRLPDASWHNPFLSHTGEKDFSNIPEEAALGAEIAHIVHDGSLECDTKVARIATGYLIFDGHLWKETQEPSYAVGSNNPRRIKLVYSADECPPHRCFRLDRLADAERFAWRLPDAKTVEISDADVDFDPRLLLRDDHMEVARELGKKVLLATEKWLDLLDAAGTSDFIDLRRQVRTGVDAQAIGIASGRMLDVIDRLPLNAHGKEVATRQLAVLTPAMIRWSEFEGGSLTTPELSESDRELLGALG
ncbi:hypothetical protein ACVIGB_000835 [Bradyrhizobium sp. USDA 4341]